MTRKKKKGTYTENWFTLQFCLLDLWLKHWKKLGLLRRKSTQFVALLTKAQMIYEMILDKVFGELLYSWISYGQTRIFWLIILHFLMGNPALSDGQSRTFWQAKVKVKRRWKNSNPTNTLPSITSYIICALVKSATNWLLFPQSNPNFFKCFNHKSRRQNCNVNQFSVKVPFF